MSECEIGGITETDYDAREWLRKTALLGKAESSDDREPAVILREELGLLQQLHSEAVDNEFLRHIWTSIGWAELRRRETLLRASALGHASAVRWKQGSLDQSGLPWELLRPTYTPELPTRVAASVAFSLSKNDGKCATAMLSDSEVAAAQEAERYVLETPAEDAGLTLWLDPGGNLETVMPANRESTVLQFSELVSSADTHCMDALCRADCQKDICNHPESLCWHCWRREETSEVHPPELRDLFAYARATAETAAPLQRASEVAMRWPFFEDVSAASVSFLAGVRSTSPHVVLIIGGVGASAVRAAKETAATVVVWEPRCFVAAAIRCIVSVNGTGSGTVQVVDGGLAALDETMAAKWSSLRLIVVEGLEMDGLLGFGSLKQLRAVQALWRRRAVGSSDSDVARVPQVLPSTLSVSVRLADARVSEVSGFDFSSFARVSKAFAPFLSFVGINATSAKPKPLTKEQEAFKIVLSDVGCDCAENTADLPWDWPDKTTEQRELRFSCADVDKEGTLASAVLVSFRGSMGADETHNWGESIFYIPPVAAAESGDFSLQCFRGSSKIWFEGGLDQGGKAGVVGPMPLHGPPFGHAYLQEWYLDMYRDTVRNDFYEEGMRRWVQKQKVRRDGCLVETSDGAAISDAPCGRVMDIGSGTGLLLFFALRSGAREALGVEMAPNLARMSEALCGTNVGLGRLPKDSSYKVLRTDALRLALPAAERPECLVTEMMDGSGLGENMVHVVLHAKQNLLASGFESEVVPRRMKLRGVLLNIKMPRIGGVDMSPLEAYWGPTRAPGGESEFANIDLDSAEAGDCCVRSDVVDIWDIDFAESPEAIAESLRARTVSFPLRTGTDEDSSRAINAVAWWFEAYLDENGCNPFPPLTNVPVFLREGNVGGGTHWHQAVAAVGPFAYKPESASLALKVRTDGKKITWMSVDNTQVVASPQSIVDLRDDWLDAARQAEEHAQRTMWQRQRMAEEVSDLSRVAALQAAAMHVGSQPGLFAVFGGASVASHILKEFFGAGCSAGF
eukprot:TRINITY_DN36773_c0_g1_i1.p1 TRINITY_DN36773_c0_g1~~TRINITY_DN36773_c0_g1_i1.p1  ORF type:complete len:1023 (-),score=159.79 TRINITY_DN36773_c0_g1_i1:250-3318(-)